ncbi:MAG TPA: rhodanese-like domain-containing protein [Flavobacterium sp.]|uniref:rhodanese-like domain-containing protein n=1 Tax=Flavobacterium sp. TaxID=239 RepID=UPI002C882E15|nr:rhodanese-like domain-containing protein [Flavobacterium sp.]HNP33613.1 rhodanese-like domain-containing protein [Flavobacterium sp.]
MLGILKNLFAPKDNSQLKEALKNRPFLVDVRTTQEFSGGSLKGAVNIPLDSIQNELSKFKNKNHIVVFCQSGMRSSQAKRILAKNGFKNVFDGGSIWNVNQLINQ